MTSCKTRLQGPHFRVKKGLNMQNVRAFFVIISAIAVLAAAAFLTASLTIAFGRLHAAEACACEGQGKPAARDARLERRTRYHHRSLTVTSGLPAIGSDLRDRTG
jgi:hypothetical protein